MEEKINFTDFELSEDLQEFIKCSADVEYASVDVKHQIDSFEIGTMIKVNKEIGSPIKILSVQEVDEKLIEAEFF